MNDYKEEPAEIRERLRQKELKNHPTSNLADSINRTQNGSLIDLVGGLGWKGTGIILAILIVGFIIYKVFFN
ncbi:DUF6366 family protein [Ornithinibacillus contaminans]|uniref:DUF6366 family protein n=1 Tax=Ornithinibacillus contaminans TaxID=694055 RepID=UPI00064D761D|nr:DUF6366 family protein [Ornithinibacillus contaminans]